MTKKAPLQAQVALPEGLTTARLAVEANRAMRSVLSHVPPDAEPIWESFRISVTSKGGPLRIQAQLALRDVDGEDAE